MPDEPLVPLPANKTTLYVACVVVLCVLCGAFVITITMIRPEKDNTSIVTSVFGIVGPVILALLAGAQQQTHLAFNSRMSQLLALTAEAAKARGVKEAADTAAIQNAMPIAAKTVKEDKSELHHEQL